MSKYLELGKEITQIIIDRYKDSSYRCVHLDDISDEVLIRIGETLYANKGMFSDYLRCQYEEDFESGYSSVGYYNYIYNMVSNTLRESGKYFWDNKTNLYLLKTDIAEVLTYANVLNKLNEIKPNHPLMIVLGECKDKVEYVYVYQREEGENFCQIITTYTAQYAPLIGGCYGGMNDYSRRTYVARVIYDHILMYIVGQVNKDITFRDIAESIWSFIKSNDTYKEIKSYIDSKDNLEIKEKLYLAIEKKLKSLNSEELITIKKQLIEIENKSILFDYCNRIGDIISSAIKEDMNDLFIYDKDCNCKIRNKKEEFKLELNQKLENLLYEKGFEYPDVLPYGMECCVIMDYIEDYLLKAIDKGESKHINDLNSEIFSEMAIEYIDEFLEKGNLKNLTKDELDIIHSNTMKYKGVEDVKCLSIRFLKEYFINVLVKRNNKDRALDFIAIYTLLQNNMDKLEPKLDILLNNGFKLEYIERAINTLDDEKFSIKKNVSDELKLLFEIFLR